MGVAIKSILANFEFWNLVQNSEDNNCERHEVND